MLIVELGSHGATRAVRSLRAYIVGLLWLMVRPVNGRIEGTSIYCRVPVANGSSCKPGWIEGTKCSSVGPLHNGKNCSLHGHCCVCTVTVPIHTKDTHLNRDPYMHWRGTEHLEGERSTW